MDQHQTAVATIAERIRYFHQHQIPFRLYHGSTNSTQNRQVDPANMVDTSSLNHVLNIDKETLTCLVEPNVPMDQLVEETLKHGLLPPIVMEFPGITVGGGFAGTAGESSGFKYGFFDSSVNWIEAFMPDGKLIRASSTENSELFHAAAGSLGTLCVTTALEMQLIKAKPYVEVTYHPTGSITDALEIMEQATADGSNDYVDGIMFAADRGVIVTGRLTDPPTSGVPTQQFHRAQDPWFYLHADRRTRNIQKPTIDIVPVRDYLFRYDRGAFWVGRYAFKYFMTPFNRITRWALDQFMHTRVMYHALHVSGHSNMYMIQDLLLPSDTAASFVDYVAEEFDIWPLWLCPFKVDRELALHPRVTYNEDANGRKTKSFVNVGVWGPGPTKHDRFVVVNRRLEDKVRELGGIKWLYAQTFYSESEFWDIYDRKWYQNLREKFGATYLPSVYDKVGFKPGKDSSTRVTWIGWARGIAWKTWPVSGLYGVWKTLSGREYLLKN